MDFRRFLSHLILSDYRIILESLSNLDLVLSPALTYGVHVRWERPQRSTLVLLNGVGRVELRDVIVWVHRYQNVGYVRLGQREENDAFCATFHFTSKINQICRLAWVPTLLLHKTANTVH